MGGAWAPSQISLIKAQPFFQLGGLNPAIWNTEDEDLCRRFAFWCEFVNTPLPSPIDIAGNPGYFYQLPACPRHQALRHNVRAEPGSFLRYLVMIASAKSAYWLGVATGYIETQQAGTCNRKDYLPRRAEFYEAAASPCSDFSCLQTPPFRAAGGNFYATCLII